MTDRLSVKQRRYRAIGANVQRARRFAELTQQQAATRSGISYSFISQCENGYYCMTVPMLLALAKTYGTTVSTLLEGIE